MKILRTEKDILAKESQRDSLDKIEIFDKISEESRSVSLEDIESQIEIYNENSKESRSASSEDIQIEEISLEKDNAIMQENGHAEKI